MHKLTAQVKKISFEDTDAGAMRGHYGGATADRVVVRAVAEADRVVVRAMTRG